MTTQTSRFENMDDTKIRILMAEKLREMVDAIDGGHKTPSGMAVLFYDKDLDIQESSVLWPVRETTLLSVLLFTVEQVRREALLSDMMRMIDHAMGRDED